jgi:hypothetical protein
MNLDFAHNMLESLPDKNKTLFSIDFILKIRTEQKETKKTCNTKNDKT